MPSPAIETLGRLISRQVGEHPERARRLLRTAYSLVGVQMRLFPPKDVLPARCRMQGATARSMAAGLGRPNRAACVNIFLPCELLHALDIPPVLPEGLSCYLVSTAAERVFVEAAEERGVPESYCSYHKILLGLAETGVMAKPRFVLNTSLACDANQLTFRRLARFWDVPHFTVDVPFSPAEDSVAYVADQLRAMGGFVQAHTGRALTEDALRAAMARARATVEGYRRYLELRAGRHLPDEMTSEMLSVFALHPMLGSPAALDYVERLCAQTVALPEGRRGKRLLWLHTLPHWQDSLRSLLNFREDVEIVGCDMTLDADLLPDPDHPYESMASRLVYSSFNGGAARRAERAAELARLLRADGAVYFCHWGCKQTSGAAQLVKARLEAAGFPTLVLDGDGCDSGNVNDGQMVTRLQAFLELLEGAK